MHSFQYFFFKIFFRAYLAVFFRPDAIGMDDEGDFRFTFIQGGLFEKLSSATTKLLKLFFFRPCITFVLCCKNANFFDLCHDRPRLLSRSLFFLICIIIVEVYFFVEKFQYICNIIKLTERQKVQKRSIWTDPPICFELQYSSIWERYILQHVRCF